MDYLINLDHQVFLYLNNMGSPTWDGLWVAMTHYWTSLPVYILIVWFLYKKMGVEKAFIAVCFIGALVVFGYLFTEVVKDVVKRPRPCMMGFDMRLLVDECEGFSFYSRHSAIALALAVLAGRMLRPRYRYATLLLVIWALVMGYSRIYVGKHFPGDVLVGWMVGIILGGLFYKAYQKWDDPLTEFFRHKILRQA